MFSHERHHPEETSFYRVVAEELETLRSMSLVPRSPTKGCYVKLECLMGQELHVV